MIKTKKRIRKLSKKFIGRGGGKFKKVWSIVKSKLPTFSGKLKPNIPTEVTRRNPRNALPQISMNSLKEAISNPNLGPIARETVRKSVNNSVGVNSLINIPQKLPLYTETYQNRLNAARARRKSMTETKQPTQPTQPTQQILTNSRKTMSNTNIANANKKDMISRYLSIMANQEAVSNKNKPTLNAVTKRLKNTKITVDNTVARTMNKYNLNVSANKELIRSKLADILANDGTKVGENAKNGKGIVRGVDRITNISNLANKDMLIGKFGIENGQAIFDIASKNPDYAMEIISKIKEIKKMTPEDIKQQIKDYINPNTNTVNSTSVERIEPYEAIKNNSS